MNVIYRKTPVEVRRVTALHECGTSGYANEVKFTGTIKASYPPWYVHRCEGCGEQFSLREEYPRLEYVDVDVT